METKSGYPTTTAKDEFLVKFMYWLARGGTANLVLGEDDITDDFCFVIPRAEAAAHCPFGTARKPARKISAMAAEVKNVNPNQSAKNSGEREPPPSIAKR